MDWQPIETAPKDGSDLLVNECGDVVIARWSQPFSVWAGPRDTYGEREVMYPTHWMPLPEPPSDC